MCIIHDYQYFTNCEQMPEKSPIAARSIPRLLDFLLFQDAERRAGWSTGMRWIGVIINSNMTFIEAISPEEIIRFCRRWQVRELALFGSALRPDFRAESDVDVLISFHQRANWGLFDHVQMRLDLEAIFKRKVDLVTRRALEQSQNELLRERILTTAKIIFAGNEAVHAEG